MARKSVVGGGVGRFKVGGETGKKADFEGVSSRKSKTLTKKAMNLIFFPVKPEIAYSLNIYECGHLRGRPRRYFDLKCQLFCQVLV